MEVFQSSFRKYHSVETALIKIISDHRLNSDANKVSILILLDLSAAFDTIDHNILINRQTNLAITDFVVHLTNKPGKYSFRSILDKQTLQLRLS